jgi:nitrogen-specific signal transduction histidine kinase
VVRLLANPLMAHGALLLLSAGCALFFGIFAIHKLKLDLLEEVNLDTSSRVSQALPVHLYSGVIQQLKQQKHELQVQTLAEQRRARTTENFSHAVLSNLTSGVVVFGTNGLVRQANPAAKEILGFRSLPGMSAEGIFRAAEVCSPEFSAASLSDFEGSFSLVSDAIHSVLHEGGDRQQVETDYTTPSGEKRRLAVTVSPVPSVDGSLLGVACLIGDRSEFERMQRQQQLQGELSAEMALQLRTSLASISGYAQQLAHNHEPELAAQLAADIASEAASLDRHIGGFLAEDRTAHKVFAREDAPGS